MGNIDIFHSRRTNYHRCMYWVRDERTASGTPEQWVTMNLPSGSFYGKSVSPSNNQMNVVNGVWALDNNFITLETDDEIDDISRGSIVKFDDKLWIVENVQKTIHSRESEYSKKIDYKYTISIRRS